MRGVVDSTYHITIPLNAALLTRRLAEHNRTAVMPCIRNIRALEVFGDNTEARLLAEKMHVLREELGLLLLLLGGCGERVSSGPAGGEGAVAGPGGALARDVGGGGPGGIGGVIRGGGKSGVVGVVRDLEGEWGDVSGARCGVDVWVDGGVVGLFECGAESGWLAEEEVGSHVGAHGDVVVG